MLHTLGITLTLSASRAFQHLHRICFVPFQGFDFAAWNSIHCIYWRSSKLHICLLWIDDLILHLGFEASFAHFEDHLCWFRSSEDKLQEPALELNNVGLRSKTLELASPLPLPLPLLSWQPRVRNPLRRKLENLHSRLFSKKINSCGRLWNYSSGNIEQLWI